MRITLLVCLLTLSACAAQGKRVDEGQLIRFEKGKTTYYDAIGQLGRPSLSVRNEDGTRQVVYTYAQGQVHWQNFVPILDRLYQGSDAESTTVQLNFDAQDKLVSWTTTTTHTPTGTGVFSGGKQ